MFSYMLYLVHSMCIAARGATAITGKCQSGLQEPCILYLVECAGTCLNNTMLRPHWTHTHITCLLDSKKRLDVVHNFITHMTAPKRLVQDSRSCVRAQKVELVHDRPSVTKTVACYGWTSCLHVRSSMLVYSLIHHHRGVSLDHIIGICAWTHGEENWEVWKL